MALTDTWYQDKFKKKVKKGFAGFPVATVAYYGPDDQRATKVAVGIVPSEGADAVALERWFSEGIDVRKSAEVLKEILDFIAGHDAKSVVVAAGILGCPHEEGTDYPEEQVCPSRTFWSNRDRFEGKVIQ
ncbi:MAG: hypothetical protein HOP23_08995 [Methylococcaceae bacterium]|nr:hypothetical protein [Methylococcaceae bacterium]